MLTSQQPSVNWFEKKNGARKFRAFGAGMSRASGFPGRVISRQDVLLRDAGNIRN